jgi:PAS domain-containing protein
MAVRPARVTAPADSTPAVGPEVLAAALSASPEATVLLDEQGRCVYVNPAACTVLGVPADDLHGRPLPFADGGAAPAGPRGPTRGGRRARRAIASSSSAGDRSAPATAAR